MLSRGHESWHPAPEFYYKAGGGPMFDMGPYYLTALVNMIGPIRRVTGSTRITFPERLITSQPLSGTRITVDVPTHVAGVLDFANGAVGTIVTSFDVYGAPGIQPIVVYGTEGTLLVPDPNGFGGTVRVKTKNTDWEEVPLTHGYTENARGIGAADIAYAVQSGRPHRASGALGHHVLETMQAFHEASDAGRHYAMTSTVERPAPLRADLPEGTLDE
jgi:predicted dehydrogenase